MFTSWIVLLLVQTSLAGTGHFSTHRRLGLLGLALAPLMVVLGVLVACEMLVRFATVPSVTRDLCRGAERDHRVSGSSLLRVKIPTTISRSQAVDHDRNHRDDHRGLWTMADRRASSQPLPAMLCAFTLLALLIAFDLKSLGRAHRATVLGSAWVLFIELSAVVVGRTAAWHAFAIHVRSLMS